MKRPDIEQLRENLDLWPEPGLGKTNALELIEYIEYLEAQRKRRDWPTEIYEQYLVALDEKDNLQERIDEQDRLLAIYDKMREDMPTDDLFEIYEQEYDEQFGVDA